MIDLQSALEGNKTYIMLGLAGLLHFAKQNGIDVGGLTEESVYSTLMPIFLALAAMFKQAGNHRAALMKKDLTIVRLAKGNQ
jgi:hypothetical protein